MVCYLSETQKKEDEGNYICAETRVGVFDVGTVTAVDVVCLLRVNKDTFITRTSFRYTHSFQGIIMLDAAYLHSRT